MNASKELTLPVSRGSATAVLPASPAIFGLIRVVSKDGTHTPLGEAEHGVAAQAAAAAGDDGDLGGDGKLGLCCHEARYFGRPPV